MRAILNMRVLFWQHGADGVICRLLFVLSVGAVLIAAGAVNVVLQWAAWPFSQIQAACTRLLRGLRP